MKLNKCWFKPKKYGYGAQPSTWEGWVSIVIFILLIYLISIFLPMVDYFQERYMIVIVILLLLFIYLTYIKTDGDWKWRWGK